MSLFGCGMKARSLYSILLVLLNTRPCFSSHRRAAANILFHPTPYACKQVDVVKIARVELGAAFGGFERICVVGFT